MPAVGKFRYAYLALFGGPAEDRLLYRLARRQKAARVLEIGLRSIDRSLRLISVCQRYAPDAKVQYAAVDWFEERDPSQPPLSLIEAHRRLGASGAKIRLSPGGPGAVEVLANALPQTDLVLISGAVTDEQLAPVWFYFPRMTHAETAILRLAPKGTRSAYQRMTATEVQQRALAPTRRQAA